MTDKLKKMAIAGLFTGLAFSFCVTAFSNSAMISARAADFVGNHYTAREATFSTSGCCEYWISCVTHEIFFTNPGGKITEAGEATVVLDASDTTGRYIAPFAPEAVAVIPSENVVTGYGIVDDTPKADDTDDIHVIDNNGDDTGVILTDNQADLQYTVVGYEGDSNVLIIPEGVTSINVNCNHDWHYPVNPFDATAEANKGTDFDKIETIILPSTITDLPTGTFVGLHNLKTVIIRCGEIGYGIFKDCPKLEFVYLANTVKKITGNPFQDSGVVGNTMKIATGHASKPAAWAKEWDIYSYYVHELGGPGRYDVTWNVQY